MHHRAWVRPGGDPVPAGNYGTGLCVLAGPAEGGYNKINSRAPPQRPGAVRGGRFLRGPGGAMDRIELIRRLNGVLLDEMPAYRGQAAGFPDDLRSAVYHEKIPAARDFACKENSGQNTSAKKTDWANAQSVFLYLLQLLQSGLRSIPRQFLPKKRSRNLPLGDLPANGLKPHSWVNCTPVRMQASTRSYVINRKPSHRLLHRAGSRV